MATISDAMLDFWFGYLENCTTIRINNKDKDAFFSFNQYPSICCYSSSVKKTLKDGCPLSLNPIAGSSITEEIIPEMVNLSGRLNHSVIANLSKVNLLIQPCHTLEQAIQNYKTAKTKLQKECETSPEYAEA